MAAGASFAVADQYGAHRELPRNAPQRLGALAWQLSKDIADSGSTIAYPADDTVDKFRRMNGVSDPELFDAVLAHGRQNAWAPGTQTVKRVQMPQLDPAQTELVAPWLLSHWESSVAKHLMRIVNGANKLQPCKLRAEDNVFEGMTPSAGQLQAVENFLKNPVSIITGLPGTGKTAVTKAICNLARVNGLRMTICAPTGKAAQVAKKATGVPAYTIHRLLGVIGGGGPDAPPPVLHNEDNKLPVAVLIVDEMSMVFVELLHLLLQAVAVGTRVVFVGDNDQLPSIGPGRCLHDMISSNAIPFVALNEIFRTQKSSPIPYWARDVRDGRMPQLTNQVDENGDGLAFVDIEKAMPPGKHDPSTIAATAASFIVKAVTDTIPAKKRGGVASYLDVTVLSPQRNGDCGVNTLNQQIQEAVNPLLEGRLTATIAYDHLARTGDPIIQGSNDYKLMLVNGEVGRVVAVGQDLLNNEWKNKPRQVVSTIVRTTDFVTAAPDSVRVTHASGVKLIAEFPTGGTAGPRYVGFSAAECRKLDLAYALTVHKAQGSSAKVIVMPVVSQHAFMLTRKLLYTGATRAERYLLLVGMPSAVAGAVTNTRDSQRRTTLVNRINGMQNAEEKDDA
jgi:exodeoxyribonuclease V alpha subunit